MTEHKEMQVCVARTTAELLLINQSLSYLGILHFLVLLTQCTRIQKKMQVASFLASLLS